MSQNIDERIVSMQFDNRQFESGAKETMDTLDKLSDRLEFKGASSNFDALSKAANNVSFAGLSATVDDISSKFTIFESFVHGIFASLGAEVAQFGTHLARSLAFDQISAGWSKYGEMATSVAAIIAATGESQEEVYTHLDKLNWFADATSYSLTQMTGAFSKFAAAGVTDSEEAMEAIMGLATASARAGIPATDPRFNRVLYNVSQAMGMGHMQVRDWASLEQANIATVEFKQALIDAAVEAEILTKTVDGVFTAKGTQVTAENLRDTLNEKWLDKKVMLKGFSIYGSFIDEVYEYATTHGISAEQAMQELKAEVEASDDEVRKFGYAAMRAAQETKTWQEAVDATKDAVSTLWMKVFQDIIGNYEEAKEVWGAVAEFLYEVFATPLEKTEEILSIWKGFGGRNYLIEGLTNAFAALGDIIDAVKAAFDGLFPSISGFTLSVATRHFRDFTKTLAPSEETLEKVTRAFKGVNAIADLAKTIFKNVWDVVKVFFNSMTGGSKSILDVAAAVGDWVANTVEAIKSSETFSKIFENLSTVAQNVGGFLKNMISTVWDNYKVAGGGIAGIVNSILSLLYNLGETFITTLQDLTGWDLSGWFEVLSNVIIFAKTHASELIRTLTDKRDLSLWESLKSLISGIAEKIGPTVEKIGTFLGNITEGVGKFIDSIDFSKITDGIKGVWEWIKKVGSAIGEWFSGLADSASNMSLGEFSNVFASIGVGAGGVGLGVVVLKIRELILAIKGLAGFGTTVAEFFGGLRTNLIELSEAAKTSFEVRTIKEIALAVLMLAVAMKLIASIPVDQAVGSFVAVSTLFGEMVYALKPISSLDIAGNLRPTARAMMLLAAAVLTLSKAAVNLAQLDWGQLLRGLLGVSILLGEVGIFINAVKPNNLMKTGFGLLEVSVAILILSKAVEPLSKIPFEQLINGLLSVGVLLAELALFTNNTKAQDLMSTGFGLIEVAAALLILSNVAEKFANFTPEQLLAGLGAVGILLGELAAFTKFVDPKGLVGAGLGMIEIAAAMAILASVTEKFASIPFEELVNAIGAIGVILAEIAGFAFLVQKFGGGGGQLLLTGAALFVVASGISIVALAVKALSSIPFDQLVQGVAALGAILLEMGVALKLAEGSLLGAASLLILAVALGALVPVIAILAAIPTENLAKAIIALGSALIILVAAGAAATVVGPGLFILAAAMLAIGVAIAGLGIGLTALSTGIMAMATLGTGAIAAFVAGLGTILASIIMLLPTVVGAVVTAIVLLVATLAANASVIVGSLVTIATAVLEGLTKLIPAIVKLVVTALGEILKGLIELVPIVLELVSTILLGIIELLIDAVPKLIELVFAAISAIIEGLTQFIPKVVEMFVAMIEAFIDAAVELIPKVVEGFMQLIQGIYTAIAENLPGLIQSGVDVIVAFLEGIGSAIPQIVDAAYKMMITFINGLADAIENNTETLLDAIDRLIWAIIDAGVAVLTHAVDNFLAAGKTIMDSGLVQGIKDKWDAVKNAVKTAITAAKNKITEKVTEWLSAGKELIDNVITGVKDKVSSIKDSVKSLIDSAKQAIVDKVSEWVTAGKNLVQGLINGILGKKQALVDATGEVAGAATDTTATTWKEKSPSKVGEEQGEYYTLGLANGVLNKEGELVSSTEEMAQSAIDALHNLLARGMDLNEEIDPTITPVLDLSEIQNGMTEMDSMFGERSLSSDLSLNNANLMMGSSQFDPSQQAIDMLQTAINKLSGVEPGQTIQNTFNVQTNDPYEFAMQVSEIIQSQVERKSAVWA